LLTICWSKPKVTWANLIWSPTYAGPMV
jgi:hypothetical protein